MKVFRFSYTTIIKYVKCFLRKDSLIIKLLIRLVNTNCNTILISESSENPTSLVWDSKSSNSIDYTN